MEPSIYQILNAPCTGEYKEKGSKFLAYVYPVFSEVECNEYLAQVKKEHPKARHHCFAWRLGLDNNRYRANDDGEPGGTAGRPILGQIDSFGLTNTLVIVVRYFGGTKLGVPGLIHAYKTSTQDALQQGDIIEKKVMAGYTVAFDFDRMPEAMTCFKKWDVEIKNTDYSSHGVSVYIGIYKPEEQGVVRRIKAAIGRLHLEEVLEAGDQSIPGLQLIYEGDY